MKENNLFFTCEAKFGPGHVCKNKGIHVFIATDWERDVYEEEVIEYEGTVTNRILNCPYIQSLGIYFLAPLNWWGWLGTLKFPVCWMVGALIVSLRSQLLRDGMNLSSNTNLLKSELQMVRSFVAVSRYQVSNRICKGKSFVTMYTS